ncbi:MAG: LpxD N-terminal domain-containing protein, partial [Acidobacteriota bacterium]
MTLQQLAERIGARLEGDGAIDVARVAALDTAGPGDVTFLANERYAADVATTRAGAIILGLESPAAPCAMLRAAQPYLAFARAAQALAPPPVMPAGVHPTAVIGEGVVLGEGVGIGPLAVLGRDVRVGARTVIEAHAVIGA